jgi:hypothetical protein
VPALTIDSVQLEVPGLSEAQARDLAHLVATGLAGATGLPDAANIPSIRLDLPYEGLPAGTPGRGTPGASTPFGGAADLPGLAQRIVAATLRAIDHAAAGTP